MKHLIRVVLCLFMLAATLYAQSDWHTYPLRSIADIIQAHSVEASQKADIIVSADPFPSKTVVTYTGKHRPVGEHTKYFIGLWVQTRNVPQENAGLLVEEYLFREKDKEYWMPVHKRLVPYLEKELKEGDEIMIYYFFLGGYSERRLLEKRQGKAQEGATEKPVDRVEWIFAVEEFQRPALKPQDESGGSAYISQPLAAAIDKSLEGAGRKQDFLIDARQVKSKSRLVYTGEVRKVGEKKLRFLQLWLEDRGLPPQVIGLLQQEVRFREGDRNYWLPIRKKTLDEMAEQVRKGDEIIVHTILAGGVPQADAIEWVFVVGDFSR
jgi:hypothetical protein